jgi:hypothetical protein
MLDVISFISDPYIPGFSFPREMYLLIPIIGFVVANIKLFADQEYRLAELQTTKADLNITVTKKGIYILCFVPSQFDYRSFLPGEYDKCGFNKVGVPGAVFISLELKIKNNGPQASELVWQVDQSKMDLPALFMIGENTSWFQENNTYWSHENGFFEGLPSSIGEWVTIRQVLWHLPVEIIEQESRTFAKKLSKLNPFRLYLNYHTDASVSKKRTLVVELDCQELRSQVIQYWNKHGFKELSQYLKN